MASVPSMVDESRKRSVEEGEPLYTRERKVSVRGTSKFSNIPEDADRIIGFGDGGEPITVEVYEDHVRVIPGGVDE
jgi:hypothetical protein